MKIGGARYTKVRAIQRCALYSEKYGSVCNTESNGLGPKKLRQTVPQSNELRIWPFCIQLDGVAIWLHAVTSSPGSG